jgi:Na(+)-translocating NADH:ubiquinone oxidoreductase B subunit
MRRLLGLFERARPQFEEGGRFGVLKPLFNAIENFFFSSGVSTADAPHVRDAIDVKRYMATVVAALLPCAFAAVYFFSWRVMAMAVVSYLVGGAIEVFFAIVRKEEINEGFLVTGLIFPLILPPGLPLWMVAVGIAFGVIVGKEIFGGTGQNLFNPALVGRCFLAIGYPTAMSSNWIEPGTGLVGRLGEYVGASSVDAITSATPLALAKQGTLAPLSDLFWGNELGSAGETSAFAILLGGTFLVLTRVANWRTVVGTLGSFALSGEVLHLVEPGKFGPVGWHLCAGGLLFGAFFMATDPVTSPITNSGKWACALIIGVATLLMRNLTGYVEGVMFAILLGNIAAPVLDEVAFRFRLRRLKDER